MERHNVDLAKIPEIKAGEIVTNREGKEIKPELVTKPSDPPRTYAYMSDTRYNPSFARYIEGVELLYHEATFVHKLKARAEKTLHSTALEAAQLASKAKVKKLLLGHFSSRYTDLNVIKREAQKEFGNTDVVIEGETYAIDADS
jgi:ribonuclease Z